LRSGANWFLWIAALSIINSIATLSGSEWGFVIGLGVTRFIDVLAREVQKEVAGNSMLIVAFIMDLIAAAVFVLFAAGAKRKRMWVFRLGMTVYALDSLLFLLIRDWVGVGFHVFALVAIYSGFKACKELVKLDEAMEIKAKAAGAAMGAPL